MHPVKVPSQDEILQCFRKAGFASFTPFQEKLIPLLLRGKDIAAEAVAGAGATVGFMLPFILGLRGAGLAPRAVILVPTAQEVGKAARAYARFSRIVRDAPAFVPLGEIEDARREQRRLEKGATIVAGTVERVIDHIRRGGLNFDELQTMIVEEPEGDARADFIKDVQFIFAKIADRRQTILFARSPLGEDNELLKLLRHPVILDAREAGRADTAEAGHFSVPTEGMVRSDLLARIMLGCRIPSAIVYHAPRVDARRIAEALQPRGLRVAHLQAGGGPGASGARSSADRRKALVAFSQGEVDVLLAPLAPGARGPSEQDDLAPSHVVFFDLPLGGNRATVGIGKGTTVIALVDRGQEKELTRLQEAFGVTINRREIPGDDEVLAGAIDRVLARMKGEDRSELAQLRARIRMKVPFLLRPFFMASLLKSLLPPRAGVPAEKARPAAAVPEQGRTSRMSGATTETSRAQRGRFGRNAANAPAAHKQARMVEGPQTGRPSLPARSPLPARQSLPAKSFTQGGGEYTQLFVSIGRNRRVYARDLTALFTEKLDLAAGDIGDVRVFEKYSFVDIAPGRAGEAIAKLSGSIVKGRTITVNYAKKKEEKEET